MAYQFPKVCPSCHAQLQQFGVHWYCVNHLHCPDQVQGRLEHALGKSALDFKGCGPSFVRTLIQENNVRTLADVYELTAVIENGAVSHSAVVQKFWLGRENSNQLPLWRKIYALGIEHIGQVASKELCQKYRSIEEIIEHLPDLEDVLGPVAARSMIDWFSTHIEEVERLLTAGLQLAEAEQSTGPFTGKVFCITGSLMSGTRPKVSAWIESLGGIVKGSVGKGTDYLVMGTDAGAGKSEAAKKRGTQVISEERLYELAGVPMPNIGLDLNELGEREY